MQRCQIQCIQIEPGIDVFRLNGNDCTGLDPLRQRQVRAHPFWPQMTAKPGHRVATNATRGLMVAFPSTYQKPDRSLAPASHAGAGPRPLHVAPDFGSRYFAGCGPFGWPLPAVAPTDFDAFLPAVFALLTAPALAATVASAPLAIKNLFRSLASAIQAGARPRRSRSHRFWGADTSAQFCL
jgi:hypothetical protein